MKPGPARNPHPSERGSVLLVALLFTAVLGIGVTSFITASYRSMQLSNRSFNGARSLQFAEMGMEEALWSLKNNDWSAWTISGTTADRTIAGFAYSDGCTGTIRLRVQNYATTSATFVAEGQTTLPDGSVIRKQLTATATQAPVFTNAIYSTGTTNFTSTALVDSYDSSAGPYSSTNSGFSAVVAGSSGASPSAGSVLANNANINGYIAYTGTAPSFGGSGSLRGPDTPSNVRIDTDRYITSPWQTFPQVKPVTGGSPLPGGDATIGTPGATTPTVYYTDELILYTGRVLTVDGPVILDITGLFYSESSCRILVTPNGSIEIHHHGRFNLGGYAIENQTLDPKKAVIISTGISTDGTDHLFFCNQPFYGILYVPNAPVIFDGGVKIFGAIAAQSVSITNSLSPEFHYDTALRSPAATFAGLAPVYQLTNWREITDASELTAF